MKRNCDNCGRDFLDLLESACNGNKQGAPGLEVECPECSGFLLEYERLVASIRRSDSSTDACPNWAVFMSELYERIHGPKSRLIRRPLLTGAAVMATVALCVGAVFTVLYREPEVAVVMPEQQLILQYEEPILQLVDSYSTDQSQVDEEIIFEMFEEEISEMAEVCDLTTPESELEMLIKQLTVEQKLEFVNVVWDSV